MLYQAQETIKIETGSYSLELSIRLTELIESQEWQDLFTDIQALNQGKHIDNNINYNWKG